MKKQNSSLQTKKQVVQLGPEDNPIDIRYDLEYHVGRLFTSQQIKGEKGYQNLKKTYQIAILAKQSFFPDNEFFHCYEYYDKIRNISLNGKTQIITVELTKLDKIIEKPVIELSVQERWALYFEYLTNIKYRDTINEIIKNEEGITMATKALMRITRSDREWAYRESKLKYELDRQSLIYETKREGIAEGRKEGISQGRIDIARNMKSLNLSVDVIAKSTGLSLEEINNL